MIFIDISKAYLHADVSSKDLHVWLPEEMEVPACSGHLQKALYGTREGEKRWENDYSDTMNDKSYIRGRSSPCLFTTPSAGFRGRQPPNRGVWGAGSHQNEAVGLGGRQPPRGGGSRRGVEACGQARR